MSVRQRFLVWAAFPVILLVMLGAVELHYTYLYFRDKQIALHEPSIAFAAYRCLADNKISAPQTDKQMAQLIYGGSAKGYYYLYMFKGLRLSDDRTTIKNNLLHIDYRVYFDGTNMVVRTNNTETPYVLDASNVKN